MFLCAHDHVCIHDHECVHYMFVCGYTCVSWNMSAWRGQRIFSGVIPQSLSTVFWSQGLSLAWNSSSRLGRLQGSTSLSPQYWDYRQTPPCPFSFLFFFTWVLEIKLLLTDLSSQPEATAICLRAQSWLVVPLGLKPRSL